MKKQDKIYIKHLSELPPDIYEAAKEIYMGAGKLMDYEKREAARTEYLRTLNIIRVK